MLSNHASAGSFVGNQEFSGHRFKASHTGCLARPAVDANSRGDFGLWFVAPRTCHTLTACLTPCQYFCPKNLIVFPLSC
jgi:hypothetical protein